MKDLTKLVERLQAIDAVKDVVGIGNRFDKADARIDKIEARMSPLDQQVANHESRLRVLEGGGQSQRVSGQQTHMDDGSTPTNISVGVCLVGDGANELKQEELRRGFERLLAQVHPKAGEVKISSVLRPSSMSGLLSNYVDIRAESSALKLVLSSIKTFPAVFFPKPSATVVCLASGGKISCPREHNRTIDPVLLSKAERGGSDSRARQLESSGYDMIVYAGTFLTHEQDGALRAFRRFLVSGAGRAP